MEPSELVSKTIVEAEWYKHDAFCEPRVRLTFDDGTKVVIGSMWSTEETIIDQE